MTNLDYWPLFHIYIIIKTTTDPIKLFFCAFIIDTQTNIQKRKRADTVPNKHAINLLALDGPTIIVDHLCYGLPSNIKEDLDDSNVD